MVGIPTVDPASDNVDPLSTHNGVFNPPTSLLKCCACFCLVKHSSFFFNHHSVSPVSTPPPCNGIFHIAQTAAVSACKMSSDVSPGWHFAQEV